MLFTIAYITIDLFSSHDPITVIFTYLTFNSGTGWSRQAMWDYGILDVYDKPILGRGFNDWSKPPWLPSSSLDNFWLLVAIRHGVPGVVFLTGTFIVTAIAIGRKKLAPDLAEYRLGWTISSSALLIAGCTVAFWGSGLTFLTFFAGCAAWLYDVPSEPFRSRRVARPVRRGPPLA